MRVIETVRACQCPRCGKPPARCRCLLKKSILQRSKCVFSFILPDVPKTETLPSIDACSPQTLQLTIQSALQETNIEDVSQLAEKDIICPRCIRNLKRSRQSEEKPIGLQVCQHCMLRAQIQKLKAEKLKSRLRSREDYDFTKHTPNEDKLEILYVSKRNEIPLTESKPSFDKHDAVTSETEMNLPGKHQPFEYSFTELDKLRKWQTTSIDRTTLEDMFRSETNFLTCNDDNLRIKSTIAEKNIGFNTLVSEARGVSSTSSVCTMSDLRELQYKIRPDYGRSQQYDICKTDQVILIPKENKENPTTLSSEDKSTESETMSYRFLITPKKDTIQKQVSSSELIRRTQDELLVREKERKQKKKERILARKLEIEKIKKQHDAFKMKLKKQEQDAGIEEEKKEKISAPSKHDAHKGEEKVKFKTETDVSKKKDKQDEKLKQEKHQKKDITSSVPQKQNFKGEKAKIESNTKTGKEDLEATKKKKSEENRLNKEQHKVSMKQDETETLTMKHVQAQQVEKQKLEEETTGYKQKKENEEAGKKKTPETDAKKEDLETLKKNKSEENKQIKKEESEAAGKKGKEVPQSAKRKLEKESAGNKKKKDDEEAEKSVSKKKNEKGESKKKREDDKRNRDKHIRVTDSELMIYQLIKEHKVKKDEERLLLADQKTDKQKISEAARKKLEAEKKRQKEEEAEKSRQIEEKIHKRTLTSKESATSATDKIITPKPDPIYYCRTGKVKKLKTTDVIIGHNIVQSKLPLPPDPLLQDLPEPVPHLLFEKKTCFSDSTDIFAAEKPKDEEGRPKDVETNENKSAHTLHPNKSGHTVHLKKSGHAVHIKKSNQAVHHRKSSQAVQAKKAKGATGVTTYALSDRSFIEKGWTVLPVEKIVRKMNVYRMRPAQPDHNWFERNKYRRYIEYDTGQKLAVFDDNGRCRWYYKNGRLALDYYEAEEANAQQRFVVYSNGEPDEHGRSRPYTVLATFDYLGNGVVFDHSGKIRLKYTQTDGVVLDRSIGPVASWQWHSLNDPPVLQQVMVDSRIQHKDPIIEELGDDDDVTRDRKIDEGVLAIEFENSIRDKKVKMSQNFKPYQIKMKALKINDNFALKVLDQSTIYLIFRDGSVHIKVNIGMILDHHEIIDTEITDLGVVASTLERFPACSESVAEIQRSLAATRQLERIHQLRHPPPFIGSVDRLTVGLSRPLKPPPKDIPTSENIKCNVDGKYSRKPPCNLYYNCRLLN